MYIDLLKRNLNDIVSDTRNYDISLMNNDYWMPLVTQILSRKSSERFSLSSDIAWHRDNNDELHVSDVIGKYTIIISCEDIASPNVISLGGLCRIYCRTRLFEFCEEGVMVSRHYQNGTLSYHDEKMDGNTAGFHCVDRVTKTGIYSYKPIIYAFLHDVEISKNEKSSTWKMSFIEK